MNKKYNCPCCGQDITAIVAEAFLAQRSEAGKAKTAKKSAAQRSNMEKLNSGYTPEKRKAAAEKRKATMASKKAAALTVKSIFALFVLFFLLNSPAEEVRKKYTASIDRYFEKLDNYSFYATKKTETSKFDEPKTVVFNPKLNAYGPGVDADDFGRPIKREVIGQPTAPTMLLDIKPNAYGLGVGSDQFGRPVRWKPLN